MDSRGFKNTSDSSAEKRSSLIKKGKTQEEVYAELRAKYPNDRDLVQKLFTEYESQMNNIRRKATKFAARVLTKYSNLSPKDVVHKARKLQKKYHFTEDEFQAFMNIAFSNKGFNDKNFFNSTNTPVAKTLGYNPMDSGIGTKMSVKTEDLAILQDILKTHQLNAGLHQQVIVQSLQYRPYDDLVYRSEFDPKTQDVRNYIHPMVVAMFFPRINYFEDSMILASISNIVSMRQNNQPVRDRATAELLHAMISDPNEGVCVGNEEKTSTIAELKNRVNVQVELWNNVYNMRNGRLFPPANNLLTALASCRNNIFDSVDSLLVVDEGSVLRRLLGVFSLRPTMIGVNSMSGMGATYSFPVSSMGMNQVTTIPIINLRLPPGSGSGVGAIMPMGPNVSFSNALTHTDQYVENKMIVSKIKTVLYSRDVMFFYVNRRYQTVNYSQLNQPYQFNQLPVTSFTGFEQLNNHSLDFEETVRIPSGDSFTIQSVLSVETADMNQITTNIQSSNMHGTTPRGELIIGNSVYMKGTDGAMTDMIFKYNPIQVTKYDPTNQPFEGTPANTTAVPPTGALPYRYNKPFLKAADGEFQDAFQTRGIVYMFTKML